MKKETHYKIGFKRGFACGYVCSLVNQIRQHGMRTEVVDNWACNRMSIDEMEECGVDEDDIKVIKENWNELNKIHNY